MTTVSQKIRVLIVDDSALARAVLRDTFLNTPDLEVAGEAENGRDALELTKLLKPDLIIMDMMMPVMDGLQAIEEIMSCVPTPILVLSATVDDRDVDSAFSAVKRGALDVMEKPDGGLIAEGGFRLRLIEKVRLLSKIRVIHHHRRRRKLVPIPAPAATGQKRQILAIGASTGGPKAVMTIVKGLPSRLPASVFIVQHIASGFARGFAQWLDRESDIPVRLAEDGDDLREGAALVAPTDCHLSVADGKVKLLHTEPVNCCRPSIDVLFSSLARECGGNVVAVLLTGMGKDGAEGLRLIKERGGATIVQDEESCAVFGMPKAALALDAADEVLPLSVIPEAVSRFFPANGG